ncbi:hypothetical protein HMJ29_05950 [Hymenobacter taeanensis]|uniref:Uncharacterized protein n=1 Tax=Hymenobacter taeanensis TaxID=2735321 RepID=A0A6M6BEY8_9BACT|nr:MULTISPECIES: hypothetical protein [Hymenobacter]QJX46502.1 hypothetical protein HMJ29_05950 [Hymenobacter taeanensis]UOQ80365.1 hypothetical protein MUN83_16270 [Hymenobacter sp. 5414T-23]
MRLLFCISLLLLFTGVTYAQKSKAIDPDYLDCSATRRLVASDFALQPKPNSNLQGSRGSFLLGCKGGNAVELLSKNANSAVYNRFFHLTSWLDTSNPDNVAQQIEFQQTQFDIQEIYARRLRKQIRASATRMFLIGKPTLDELAKGLLKEAELRQVQYADETAYASLPEKQAEWSRQIQQELQELQAYQVLDNEF